MTLVTRRDPEKTLYFKVQRRPVDHQSKPSGSCRGKHMHAGSSGSRPDPPRRRVGLGSG